MQNSALAVDDDQHTLFFIEQVLRPTGLEIILAQDGRQALDTLKSVTPSVLFLDMLLPHISGIELLDFILKTPRLNATYVVVVSAHNHFPSSEQLARVDTYLVKPVRPKEIRDAALYAIERQAAG
jgi:two-component system, OmpR family, alkaline phosphatase synthesis response regulator PhoP